MVEFARDPHVPVPKTLPRQRHRSQGSIGEAVRPD
jgi:hypothetical protein